MGKNRFTLGKYASLGKENSAGAVVSRTELRWSCLTLPLRKGLSEEELLWSSRTMLEQYAPWKILREIQD
jgi:hypothetical protein